MRFLQCIPRLAALVTWVAFSALPAAAGTIFVTTTDPYCHDDPDCCEEDDTSCCALIDAIVAAKNADSDYNGCTGADSGDNTISLEASGTYKLTQKYNNEKKYGLPKITTVITIDGDGNTIHRKGDSDNFRVFEIASGASLTLQNLKVSGGKKKGGGAIRGDENATLIIDQCTFKNNDSSGGSGGAILLKNGSNLTVTSATFLENQNDSKKGGAIKLSDSEGTITNSTFSGNTSGSGGAIAASSGATVDITLSTFNDNVASDGTALYSSSSFTHYRQSIFAGGATLCSGNGLTSQGYNISEDGSCGGDPTDQTNTDPLLSDALSYDGAMTATYELECTDDGESCSPAINGVLANCGAGTDQRGEPRPQGEYCDIGAYEAVCESSASNDGILTITIQIDDTYNTNIDSDTCELPVVNDSYCEVDTVSADDCTITWVNTDYSFDGLEFLQAEGGATCPDNEECCDCTDWEWCNQDGVTCECQPVYSESGTSTSSSCWPDFLSYENIEVSIDGLSLSVPFSDCSAEPSYDEGDGVLDLPYELVFAVGIDNASCELVDWDPKMAVKSKTSK